MKLKHFIYIALLTSFLTGCDNVNITSRESVSVDTNAFYTAFQKNPTDQWRQINFNNDRYRLETLTFTIDDENKPYSVVFVCPAKEDDVPNQVYIFYATAIEMQLLDFRCRKSKSEFTINPLFGRISGVNIASFSDSSQGELVHLAFSDTVTTNALEAFAVEVKSGRRDVVGFKGKHISLGNKVGTPEEFLISRGVTNELTETAVNINVGFIEGSSNFHAPFDYNALSNVKITGAKEGDIFSSDVKFLSVNKTTLTLVQSDQNSYSFTPVPLLPFTEQKAGEYQGDEFNINEGHELSVVVNDENGKVDRQAIKFFSTSDAQTHTLNLPKSIPTSPTLSLTTKNKFQNINLSWDEYSDAASGKTQLYRWVFEGQSADKAKNSSNTVNADKLIWYVYATPGWLKTVSRTPNVYNLTLPTNYAAEAILNGERVNVWKDEWAFKASTPIDWEFTVFSASENGNSGLVIDYLLNRNISENYSFTRVFRRSKLLPSS